MLAHGQTVIQLFEQLAPKHYALPDDKIGLQLGSLNKKIQTVHIALDVNEEVVDEAIREGAELIIAHHAIIYRPLAHLQTDTPAGRLYEKLLRHGIAVYIAHTNLDVAPGGMNDWMAEALGLTQCKPLETSYEDALYKIAVYVPEDHAAAVREAMFAAGAGHIGGYSHCSFNVDGTGTFRPGEQASPFIGTRGKLERVQEVRIETVVPASVRNRTVQALLRAHPYEEPAYDIYALHNQGTCYGLGRVGKLAAPISLGEMAEEVKRAFEVPFVRVVGDLQRPIAKAAVLGGSGGRYVKQAIRAGADVLITGDIDYHTAQDAQAAGLALIDPGHNAEKIMKSRAAAWLRERLEEAKYTTRVTVSEANTEPFALA